MSRTTALVEDNTIFIYHSILELNYLDWKSERNIVLRISLQAGQLSLELSFSTTSLLLFIEIVGLIDVRLYKELYLKCDRVIVKNRDGLLRCGKNGSGLAT